MSTEVLLLVFAEVGIGPIGTFNILDSLEKRGARNIHFTHHRIVETCTIELCHFHIGLGHVGIVKIGSIQGCIKERCSNQIAAPKVCISHNTLLEGNTLEVLTGKIRIVQIDTSGNGNGSPRLKGGCSSCGNFGIGIGAGTAIIYCHCWVSKGKRRRYAQTQQHTFQFGELLVANWHLRGHGRSPMYLYRFRDPISKGQRQEGGNEQ
mmetsp:Transcript_36580/g.105396  ORF Transcript_36580/g.105396 Transcript_36580/m.105396 type:complete len:207 (-) Transcript_36580:53-673(-)